MNGWFVCIGLGRAGYFGKALWWVTLKAEDFAYVTATCGDYVLFNLLCSLPGIRGFRKFLVGDFDN